MFKSIVFYLLLLYPTLAKNTIWNKYYLTYSLENYRHMSKNISEAIKEWSVSSLEVVEAPPGKGDIKIFFKAFRGGRKLGETYYPELGLMTLNETWIDANITKVIQHEFGHALGLEHDWKNAKSIMYFHYLDNSEILDSDKERLNDLYKCGYDSVALLNGYTYLKFKGRHYERIDIHNNNTSNDIIWHPSITKVKTMYRNNNYFILSADKFYEFNHNMTFIKDGFIREKFPRTHYNITAVLTLRNESTILFLEHNYIWYNNTETHIQKLFKEYPEKNIHGAYINLDRIFLFIKDYVYIYNENFILLTKNRLCDDPILYKIHCCNNEF